MSRRGRGERPPRRRPAKGTIRPLPPIHLDRRAAAEPEFAAPSAPQPAESRPAPPPPLPQTEIWLVLAVLALAAVSFLPSLSTGFISDDRPLVVDNQVVRSPGNIGAILTQPYISSRPNSYHPLATLTYLVDFQVWQLSPEGYHSTNLTLHLIATLLVYATAMQLTRRQRFALAAAAVFAVNPVHVQSIAWIGGRPQLLATCLALFALLAYGSYASSAADAASSRSGTYAQYAASVTAFTLALFAHAAAGATILLLPMYDRIIARWRLTHRPTARLLTSYAGFVAAVAVYLAARWSALGHHLAVGFDLAAWPAHLFTLPLLAARGIELMLLPVRSQPYFPLQLVHSPLRPDVLSALIALAVLIALISRLSRVSPSAGFAAWWSLLTLAPTLNFLPLRDAEFPERNLYLPSVGVALIVGWLMVYACDRLAARGQPRGRTLVTAVFAVAVILGMVVSWLRTSWYRDEVSLLARTERANPCLAQGHFDLDGA